MSSPTQMLSEIKTMPISQIAPWLFSRLSILKRYPHAEELFEIFNSYFASCVHLKHLFFIKEGIYRIRGICINNNDYTLLNSVCDRLISLISVDKKSSSGEQTSPVQLYDIPFLSTNTMDSAIKFKWDSIRLILDLLKFKNHSVYQNAFEFCAQHRKTREGLKLSYEVLKNKALLMQLGYQPYFELQLSHLNALYKLNLNQQALGVANDITSTLLNSADGFGGISFKLFAKDLQDQMQNPENLLSMVTDDYIAKHGYFELLCKFYKTLALDEVIGSFALYKLFLLRQFKNAHTDQPEDLRGLMLEIILSLMSTPYNESYGRKSLWAALGFNTTPTNIDLLKTILSKNDEFLTTDTRELIDIYLNAPPYQIAAKLKPVLKVLPKTLVERKLPSLRKSLYIHVIRGLSRFYSSISFIKILKLVSLTEDESNNELEFDSVLLWGNVQKIINIKIDKSTSTLHFQKDQSQVLKNSFEKLSYLSMKVLLQFKVQPISLNDKEFGERYRYNKDLLEKYKISYLKDLEESNISTHDTLSKNSQIAKKIEQYKSMRTAQEKIARDEKEKKRQDDINKVLDEKNKKDEEIAKQKEHEIDTKNKERLSEEQKHNMLNQLETSGITVSQIVLENKTYKGSSAIKNLSKEFVTLIKNFETKKLADEQAAYVHKFSKDVDYIERALQLENENYVKKNSDRIQQDLALKSKSISEERESAKSFKESKSKKIHEVLVKHKAFINFKRSELEKEKIEKDKIESDAFKKNQSESSLKKLSEIKSNIKKAKQEIEELKQKEYERGNSDIRGRPMESPQIEPADNDNNWRRGGPSERQRSQSPQPVREAPTVKKYVPPAISASAKYVPPASRPVQSSGHASSSKYVPPAIKAASYVPPTSRPNQTSGNPSGSKYVPAHLRENSTFGVRSSPSLGIGRPLFNKTNSGFTSNQFNTGISSKDENKEEDWTTVRKK
eukprot:NODE_618_length_5352_cov_0.421854.p1 type:complete len:954 gc:universal NODE_618_length_5352_cov_0.421854:3016-155(-)